MDLPGTSLGVDPDVEQDGAFNTLFSSPPGIQGWRIDPV